ncbi:MAG: hypothetical protein JW881_04950 [Spirochaetales bacterium]|nr:hypothetical protein [Spirochaetales bacterium]
MKHAFMLFIMTCCLLASGCVSTDTSKTESDTRDTQAGTDTASTGEKDVQRLSKMQDYLDNGLDKINYGSYAEGMKQLVLVLAEKHLMKSPPAEATELAVEAEQKLKELEAALSLEVDPSWLDVNLNQVSGSSVDIKRQPSVLLTIDTGLGRSLIANAPIAFSFIKGSGILSASVVNTNDYGQANVVVSRFDNANSENIIRAQLFFREHDYLYTFEGVVRNFIYTPPARKAVIFVMERSDLGISDDPKIFEVVYDKLKDVAFDFSLYNASLAENTFNSVYNGDKKAIGRLGLEEDVSYIVAVLNDCYRIAQQEYKGKKLNAFVSEARATIRIIRVSDGKTLYNKTVKREKADNTHGQGGTMEKAALHALSLTTDAMEQMLSVEIDEINSILMGAEKKE